MGLLNDINVSFTIPEGTETQDSFDIGVRLAEVLHDFGIKMFHGSVDEMVVTCSTNPDDYVESSYGKGPGKYES